MRPLRWVVLVATVALTTSIFAAVRLTYDFSGKPIPVSWPASAFPLRYTVERSVADKYGIDTIDHAFNAWTTVPDANISFRDTGISDGTQSGQNGISSVTMLDGLFKDQGFIAVTTNWYDTNGSMTEADIQIDPSLVGTSYPAAATIEHEVGHFLGLDHSPVLSAVMYPYVCKNSPASLDSDDRIAIAAVYPKVDPTSAGATLTGRVTANGTGIFAAQVVAVNSDGEPVATGLTNSTGDFILEGVPEGTYRIYSEPLDGPVQPANLDGIYRGAKVTAFPTRFVAGAPITVKNGSVYGNLAIDAGGPPVTLNPKYAGLASSSNGTDFALTAATVAIKPGTTVTLAVGGDGFTSGMTTFEVLNPLVKRTSDFHYGANYVYATFQVAPGAVGGSSSIFVTSGNDTAALTGAVRIDGLPRTRAARH
ncbi:MAG TPA: matrixin family metalloprotease [Thermoanaerobaculia bacterium]|nr:matrixin family metalloprotease [Thermoanaerobaculia bacterium]